MAYNQFSRPVAPPDLYSSIGDDILLRGAMQTYENAAKAGQNLSAYQSELFGVNTYGKDAEVLADYENQFNENVKELSQYGISSPEAMSRMNTLISSYTNNPDILAIRKRANAYNSELQAKKEAEAKSKNYVSPILRQGNKYYSGDSYYRDEQFNGSGFVAPDIKELDEIAKNTPEWENWVKKGGYDIHQKGKAVDSLFNNYHTYFINNPQWRNLIEDQFEQSIEGVDLNQLMANPNQYIAELFPYLPDDQKQDAVATLSQYQQMQGNPFFESAVKDKLRNDYFKNQAFMAAQAKTYVNTVDMKVDDYDKSARDFQEAKQLERYKKELDLEFPKDSEDVISLIQGLEDFKTTKQGIPGLLNTDVFQKEITVPEETLETEVNDKGETTSTKKTVKTIKKKVSPRAVGYRKSDDTFTISYPDGSTEQLTTQQVIDKVGASKPALAKYLKSDNSIITNSTDPSTLTTGKVYTLNGVKYLWNGKNLIEQ